MAQVEGQYGGQLNAVTWERGAQGTGVGMGDREQVGSGWSEPCCVGAEGRHRMTSSTVWPM